MKKQISRALVGLFAALMLAGPAAARTSGVVKVYIPFDFVAGQKQMPAGGYTVSRVRRDSESTLLIRGEGKGAAAAIVLTPRGGDSPRRSELTFRQHGDVYFLAGVSIPGAPSVRETPKTGAERRVERELAARTAAAGGAEQKKVTVIGSVQ